MYHLYFSIIYHLRVEVIVNHAIAHTGIFDVCHHHVII